MVDVGYLLVLGTTGYDYSGQHTRPSWARTPYTAELNWIKALLLEGDHSPGLSRPAATLLAADPIEDKMKIEIEVTARIVTQ